MKNIFFLGLVLMSLVIFGSFDSDLTKKNVDIASQLELSQMDNDTTELFIVISDSVAMRSGPGSKFNAAKFLNKNAKVEVLSKEYDEWYIAKHEEVKGFINKKHLKPLELNTFTID